MCGTTAHGRSHFGLSYLEGLVSSYTAPSAPCAQWRRRLLGRQLGNAMGGHTAIKARPASRKIAMKAMKAMRLTMKTTTKKAEARGAEPEAIARMRRINGVKGAPSEGGSMELVHIGNISPYTCREN